MSTLIDVIERLEREAGRFDSELYAPEMSTTRRLIAAELRALLTEAQGQGIVAQLREAVWNELRNPVTERGDIRGLVWPRGGNPAMDTALASVLLAYGIEVGQPASPTECCCSIHHQHYGRCLQCPTHGTEPPRVNQ